MIGMGTHLYYRESLCWKEECPRIGSLWERGMPIVSYASFVFLFINVIIARHAIIAAGDT